MHPIIGASFAHSNNINISRVILDVIGDSLLVRMSGKSSSQFVNISDTKNWEIETLPSLVHAHWVYFDGSLDEEKIYKETTVGEILSYAGTNHVLMWNVEREVEEIVPISHFVGKGEKDGTGGFYELKMRPVTS